MAELELTYRVARELSHDQVVLSTYWRGYYIGESIGYWSYDHKSIKIYPYKLNGRYPDLELKTTRYRHEIEY